jgi:hypothetical protein
MAARTGGCLCGAVRYESAGEPLFSLLCHCHDCQHQSGSAFIAAMRVPAAGFRITKRVQAADPQAHDVGPRRDTNEPKSGSWGLRGAAESVD